MGVWFVYVGTRHAPLAWVSFGILVAAIAAGLSWLARNRLAARHSDPPARAGFPPRLILLHGLTATATFALAVLTALAAILGMIPLAESIFWGPMAITIMGGLFVATLLTLLVLPVFYITLYRAKQPEAEAVAA